MYNTNRKIIYSLAFFLFAFFLIPFNTSHAATTDWKIGANIKPYSTTDFASEDMKRSLVELKNDGANYAILIIPYYQADRGATEMRPGWNTPTDDALATAIDYAHSIGLKVMLMPHLETDYIEWRGNIDPSAADRPAWYASYTKMLIHYASIAQAHRVEDFALGAELIKMTNPYYDAQATTRWQTMIAQVRKVFSGKVTYSANRDFEFDTLGFWPQLDYMGLSAYYDLYHATSADVDQLKNSWDNWKKGIVEPIQKKYNKDLVITEIGYRSITGTYRDPWDWGRSGAYNEQEQANAYEALFSYWNTVPWMKGVYLWRWNITAPGPNSGDTDYTPQNKLAESVMKKWFNPSGTTIPISGGSSSGSSGTGGTTGGTTGGSTGGSTGGTGTTQPPPPPANTPIVTANSTLDIWWPGDGSWVSGVQPFKAMVSDGDINRYDMYWQVDGDRWNMMNNSTQDYPHKEVLVDVSGWYWKGNGGTGPYTINFLATDKTGKILLQKSVNINVGH